MNTLYALMIVTTMGTTNEAATFQTLEECKAASVRVKLDNFCVAKKPVNMELEAAKFMGIFKMMIQQMDSLDKKPL